MVNFFGGPFKKLHFNYPPDKHKFRSPIMGNPLMSNETIFIDRKDIYKEAPLFVIQQKYQVKYIL